MKLIVHCCESSSDALFQGQNSYIPSNILAGPVKNLNFPICVLEGNKKQIKSKIWALSIAAGRALPKTQRA